MNPLNAQDFGFRPANSGTDNRLAWAKAITEAQAQGKPLYIPAGTYALEMTSNEGEQVELTQSVTIFGDGPEYTVIDIHPKIVSFPFRVIWWNTPDLHVTVRGLQVLGPTGTSETHPDLTPICSFLQGLTKDPFGSDNRITVDDVVVTGKFMYVIHTANGDGLVDVRNSDFTALSVCVAVFETTNRFLNKRFHADNCRFASGVPAEQTSGGEDPFGICVYLHPHVATRVTNCRFYDNPRDAIKQYGEEAVGNAPKYSQYIGCHFFNCTGFTIITPGEDVVTLIEACSFEQGDIACRNNTAVIGCDFRNSAGITTTVRHRKQFEVNVVGCRIHRNTPEKAFRDSESMSLLVRDSVFSFAEGCNEETTAGVSLGQAAYGEVSGCRFVGQTTSSPHASSGVLVSPQAGTRHKVEHCSFAGNFHVAGLAIQPGTEGASVEVNGCDFSQVVVGAPVHFNSASSAFGNVIRGRDNIFNNQPLTTGGQSGEMAARLRPRPAMAVETVAVFEVPSENPASPKRRIVLDPSYNTFNVTGSLIDEVHIGVAGKIATNKFEGPVHLIARTRLRLTRNGNIRPRNLTLRNVHQVLTLFHDPATGLWSEQ
jgi:hypothetical protein